MFGPSRRVARRTARRTSRRQAAFRGGYEEPEPSYTPSPAPAVPAEPDYATELQRLADLKAKGILTQEEFEAKKKQILGI
jgi:hypothetical protein